MSWQPRERLAIIRNTIADATLVTNREYEEEKQDVLRKIRLLDPEYLEQFVEEFERLVSETED